MSRSLRCIAGVALDASTLMSFPSSSSAAVARPTLSIIHPNLVAGQSFTVNYSGPAGFSLWLQHQVGTAHVWRSVKFLNGTHGTITAPGAAMGRWDYRILAHNSRGSSVSATQVVYSYGSVPLANWCASIVRHGAAGMICQNGTVQIGATPASLTYSAFAAIAAVYPNYDLLDTETGTTCRSLSLRFTAGPLTGQSEAGVYVSISQPNAATTYASAPVGTLGTLNLTLSGRAWSIYASTDYPRGATEAYALAFNGRWTVGAPMDNDPTEVRAYAVVLSKEPDPVVSAQTHGSSTSRESLSRSCSHLIRTARES